ncbi:uncharacterized protein [Lepeophtheirus salmonis]|uniref:uncharacterized protein isoform X2 n=1 Tax=Lepeophtheirus salmonis TaxID=72036 RepID=UPI001AE9C9AD|nr:uncharacterized protein LOC121127005 isoform X2 [Lepeophtheirus salmonis]
MMRIILLLLLTFYVSNVSLIKTTSHADLIRQSILNISETSQWAKLNRRKMVKNQVERILNIGNRNFNSSHQFTSNLWNNIKRQFGSSSILPNPTYSQKYWNYTEKLRSIFPTCRRWIDSNIPNGIHLYFNISSRTNQQNYFHQEIIRGRLNLFKTTPRNTNTSYLLNKNVRITVSWIKRVKGDHIMMDSKILPIQSEKWISLDILVALRYWHKNPRKNFGIFIEVMDGNQKTLPTNEYIVPMNCSDTTTLAFPSIIEAKDGNINSKLYPLLDILIVELPNFTDYLKKIPVSHERISNTNHNYNHGYLMKFPILDISPKVSKSNEVNRLKKIEDVSFMEQDPLLSNFNKKDNVTKINKKQTAIFQPVMKKVIRNRKELITALKDLVQQESMEKKISSNILDKLHIEDHILEKLSIDP